MTQIRNFTVPRLVLALIMMTMGVLHFTHGQVFASIVPDYLPEPLLLVYVSGVAEFALGAMLLSERTRVLAAWGLFALYLAVFPANIHWALHPDLTIAGMDSSFHVPAIGLWLRLPLQFGLLYWAWLYTRKDGGIRKPASQASAAFATHS